MAVRTISRAEKFKPGYDPETGIRKTKIDEGKREMKKTHTPQLEGIIALINIPDTLIDRKVPADPANGHVELPYEEFHVQVTGGFVLVNSFLGKEAAGQQILCQVKIGLKELKSKNNNSGNTKAASYYYLKLTSAPQGAAVTHTITFDRNGLTAADYVEGRLAIPEDGHVFHLLDLQPGMDGGIIILPV